MGFLKRLFSEEDGQGITEYALILALVVFVIWLAVKATGIGESVSNVFTNVGSVLDNPTA
ncbi:MAG: Flp family type IVb pilin [Candidatus Binatia bacterium]